MSTSLRLLRRRIRSIRNTAKVTRAMEMIAASRMRRAQARVLAGRPYAQRLQELLSHLAAVQREGVVHPLLERREVRRIQVVHITPDRGLAGVLPTALNRRTGEFILQQKVPVSVIAVGKKGSNFMVRYGRDVRAVFTGLGDRPTLMDTLPISRIVLDDYTSGYADEVYLVYAQFISTVVQRPILVKLLPIEAAPVEPGAITGYGYIYEPSSTAVLQALLPRFVEMQVYHAILEAIASEQSARMVAMRNATQNANEMIEQLTLVMNKVRQETITKELMDIVGGVVALER